MILSRETAGNTPLASPESAITSSLVRGVRPAVSAPRHSYVQQRFCAATRPCRRSSLRQRVAASIFGLSVVLPIATTRLPAQGSAVAAGRDDHCLRSGPG
jgi:hypothetical protein